MLKMVLILLVSVMMLVDYSSPMSIPTSSTILVITGDQSSAHEVEQWFSVLFGETESSGLKSTEDVYNNTLSPEVINLEGKTCSRLPEKYPKDVYYATGGFINGQVIICGGVDHDAHEYLIECYTLKKGGSWTLLGNLSQIRARTSSVGVVLDDSLYVIGGRNYNSSTIESMSINGTLIQHETEYPHKIYFHSSVNINRTASITTGGIDSANRTYFYNGKEFLKGPDLITGRYDHGVGLLRDKVTNDEYIAVVGGNIPGGTKLDSLELLKIGDNKWKSGNPLPKKLSGIGIVSIGGDIIVIGGLGYDHNYNYKYQSAIYKLSCQNGNCQWTTLPQSLKFARSNMIAVAIPDDFFDCN